MPVDIVLYALVAAGLVFWLRSLLGTRRDGEPQRPNPFADGAAAPLRGNRDAKGQPAPARQALLPNGTIDIMSGLDRSMGIRDDARDGLAEIARADKGFAPAHFLKGAQDAFVMIVEAFASGYRVDLQPLIGETLYRAFDRAIAEREERGEKSSVEIHAVRHAEILKAWMQQKTAYITVRFTADETNVVHDKDGNLLSGHPDRVTETIDIWTFARDTKSRSPGWVLTETREDDAANTAPLVPDA